jgi:predicted  nucleic acid-binding Zn-ribbon protein
MGMTNGSTICSKHDSIESLASEIIGLVQDAKNDGVDMEKKLEKRKKEVENLEDQITDLEKENDKLRDQVDELEKEISSLNEEKTVRSPNSQ